MEYRHQLFPATVVKRFNSMIVDIKLSDDTVVPAFCSRREIAAICAEGMQVMVKRSANKLRIIKHKIEFINKNERLIFSSPRYEERLFKEAFENGLIEELNKYSECRELEANDHLPHIQCELSNEQGQKCYVFITTLFGFQAGKAVFPISIDFFEIEMLEEMQKLRQKGFETFAFMIVPQSNCLQAEFSWKISPVAAAKIFEEAKNGLQFVCYGCNVNKTSVSIANKIEIIY